MRSRLDAELVRRGLAESRTLAARLIESGCVTVAGEVVTKASRTVSESDALGVLGTPPYVSRAGEKLVHALDAFAVNIEGRSVLDAGASTGGFTDCVLQRGARRVFAVDVGHDQLHRRLRDDPRVYWRDGVNVRSMAPSDMAFPCSLAVVDLSFISLTKVLPALVGLVSAEDGFPGAEMVLLVKPQFEAGREEVSRARGVIVDAKVHEEAVNTVSAAVRDLGGLVAGVETSPVPGADGNTEFLMHVECPTSSVGCVS